MAWTPNRPSPTTSPAGDVADLAANWDYMQTFANKDHRFTTPSTDGYHQQVNMPATAAAPTVNLDGVLYVFDNGTTKELRYGNSVQTSSVSGVVARASWEPTGGLYNQFNVTSVTATNAAASSFSSTFDIVFSNPMPTAQSYTVIAMARASNGQAVCNVLKANKLTTGFKINVTQSVKGGSLGDLDFVVYRN